MSVELAYWRSGMLVGNVGDCLSPWLLDRLGIAHAPYRADSTEPVLFAVGSILSADWLAPVVDRRARRAIVWGSGVRAAGTILGRDRLDVIGVRGPVSARQLGLGAEAVIGDPGLLVARLWPHGPPERVPGRIVWVRHFDTNRAMTNDLAALACTDQTSMRILTPWATWRMRPGAPLRRLSPYRAKAEIARFTDDPLAWLPSSIPSKMDSVIRSIATAEFVLADSLHGAIIAQSFGVPWAAHEGARGRVPTRWADWFGFIGVEPAFSADARAGMEWHRAVAPELASVSDDRLLASVETLRQTLRHLRGGASRG